MAAGMADGKTPTAGGAALSASKNIVENASASSDHTTLVAAVKAAGLVDTLSGAGPFTVFAPTNAAFDALPAGTVDTLLKPESKDTLTSVLTYHVVAGNMMAADLAAAAEKNGGVATLTTVQGGTLTVSGMDGTWYVTDAKGNKATITAADMKQSNGVIHVIDTVLMP
nr:fasciclin domain-containing protein [Chiayiivirga flava]